MKDQTADHYPIFTGARFDGETISIMVCTPENERFTHLIIMDPVDGLRGMTVNRKAFSSFEEMAARVAQLPPLHANDEIDAERDDLSCIISTHLDNSALQKALTQRVLEQDTGFAAAYGQFLADMMDARLREIASVAAPISAELMMNWLTSGDRTARQQAVEAFPFLVNDFIGDGANLTKAIDNRESLADAIADYYKLDSKALAVFLDISKKIRAAPAAERQGLVRKCHHSDILAAARLARLDQIPDTPGELTGIAALLGAARLLVGISVYTGEDPVMRTVSRVKPDGWEALREMAAKYPSREIRDFLRNAASAVASAIVMARHDQKNTVDYDLIGPAAADLLSDKEVSEKAVKAVRDHADLYLSKPFRDAHSDLTQRIEAKIAEGFSLKGLREKAERWHHIADVLRNEMLSSDVQISWVPMIGMIEGEGFRIRELSDSHALQHQGSKANQDHCVGSYTANVMQSHPYESMAIFSIEKTDEDGNMIDTMSTLALRLSNWSARPTIHDHKAVRNSPPSIEAQVIARNLIDTIEQDGGKLISAYRENLSCHTHSVQQAIKSVIGSYGGNVFVESFAKTTLDIHRELLPKSLQGMTLGQLGAHIRQNENQEPAVKMLGYAGPISSMPYRGNDWGFVKRAAGLVLEELGVRHFEVKMSGSGDSGQIDEFNFTGEGGSYLSEAPIKSALSQTSVPASCDDLWWALEVMTESEASDQGDWVNNDGGNVDAAYFLTGGRIETEYVTISYNEYEDDEFDEEFDEEFEAPDEPEGMDI